MSYWVFSLFGLDFCGGRGRFCLVWGRTTLHVVILVPWTGANPRPQKWDCRPPERSLFVFTLSYIFKHWLLILLFSKAYSELISDVRPQVYKGHSTLLHSPTLLPQYIDFSAFWGEDLQSLCSSSLLREKRENSYSQSRSNSPFHHQLGLPPTGST